MKTYTEEELFKAIKYACEHQKFVVIKPPGDC